jgi:hypothetical protein
VTVLRRSLVVLGAVAIAALGLATAWAVPRARQRYERKKAQEALVPDDVMKATCSSWGWEGVALPGEPFNSDCMPQKGYPGARLSWVCRVGPREWILACESGGIAYLATIFRVTQGSKIEAEARPLDGLPPPVPDCSQASRVFEAAAATH